MNITIRKSSTAHDITINEDGKVSVFDLAAMPKGDRHKARRMLVGALAHAGVLNDQGGKFAVGRKAHGKRRRPRRQGVRIGRRAAR